MGIDILGDKEIPDVAVDSVAKPASPVTPSGAVNTGQAGRIFRVLLQGVVEIDLWVQAGHTPACFGLMEDSAALADSFVAGVNAIPDHLKDAARLIKGCAVCTEVLKDTVEDMGGTLPQAWQDLEPANMENLPEGADEGGDAEQGNQAR